MGVSKANVHYLLHEGKRNPFSGRLLTLGVQKTTISHKELESLAGKLDYPLRDVDESEVEMLDRHHHLTDMFLFKRLGFDEVVRTDFSDFQGAEFVFDFNNHGVPDDYKERFDVVLDGGTLEHVFHVPNSFYNIFSLLKVGGRVIHVSPVSNMVDHGFYMFSPTLFYDFYTANNFDINTIKLIETNRWGNTQKWLAGNYEPGSLRYISGGGLQGGQYGVVVNATKTEQSTGDAIPQQHRYEKTWKRKTKRKKARSMLAYRFIKRAEQFWKKNRTRRFPLPISDRF